MVPYYVLKGFPKETKYCWGQNRNLIYTHTASSRYLIMFITITLSQDRCRAAAENRAALWSATPPPPSLSPSAPASASGYCFPYASTSACSTTQWDGQQKRCSWKLECILDWFDCTATTALLLAKGESQECGWKGTRQLLSAAALLRSALKQRFKRNPCSSSRYSDLDSTWFTHIHTALIQSPAKLGRAENNPLT